MKVSFSNMISPVRPRQGIRDAKKAGMERFFLNSYAYFSLEMEEKSGQDRKKQEALRQKYGPETIVSRYQEMLQGCKENQIQISFIGMPPLPRRPAVSSEDPALTRPAAAEKPEDLDDRMLPELEEAFAECCRLCKMADAAFLVMTVPFDRIENDFQRELLSAYLLRCAGKAEDYGVTLLLTNKIRILGGHIQRGFCSEDFEAVQWIDRLNRKAGREAFGFCADIGVCSLCGNDFQSYIRTLGNRLKVVALSDSDGCGEAGMLPFTYPHRGQTLKHWLGVIRGLRDICFDGELAIEFGSTSSSFSPLLKPYFYPLVKAVGNYFKWQIEIENNLKKYEKFVLFGAGNMCRNYMKCYGKQYPPQFTCDNDPRLWGTVFEGLEVRNPKELKNLPKDWGVIICNVYYREIEAQLKELGIENIGYFNDEYMPEFYYDRLDRENDG